MVIEGVETIWETGGALLFRLMRSLGAVEDGEVRCCGLTTGQGLALLALQAGELTIMREVATALGVSAGTATRVVDNLVRDGLVERIENPADRRSVCIEPTVEGEKTIENLKQCYQRFWQTIFERVPVEQLSETVNILTLLVNAAEETVGVCCTERRR